MKGVGGSEPVAERLDVAAKPAPAREAVASCEVEPRLGDGHAADRGDAVGAALVVLEVRVERLLGAEPLDVRLQLRPAREALLAGELELRLGQLDRPAGGLAGANELLRLLAQLLEIEL